MTNSRVAAILSGILVTAVIIVAALVMSSPDAVTWLLAIAIGATVTVSIWAREGIR
ncbi:MAG: hypothetical protein M3173_02900 [Chloroflexota bacterium]|nr:hypothetical protein [Chloroflexota bacterium]